MMMMVIGDLPLVRTMRMVRMVMMVKMLSMMRMVRMFRRMRRVQMVKMMRMKMPAAGAFSSATRLISRALTDQLDLRYFNNIENILTSWILNILIKAGIF